MKYRFSDLADIPKLQELMGSLYWLTDIAIGIIDVEGRFLFCAGWRGSCSNSSPRSCDCLDYILQNLDPVSYTYKQCPSGMLHYACPIVVEGEHLASVYIGQFFTEPPDKAAIEMEAARRCLNAQEYLKSLQKIAIVPPMKLSLLLKYLKDLANMLAEMGLQRLHQMEALEKLRLNEERLQYLSAHDPLTGLLNRSSFEETLQSAFTEDQLPLSIIICDLDSLKLINDTMGHPTGDILLKTTATILSEVCPANAVISRIGGDEYAILLPLSDQESALSLKNQIQVRVDKHNSLHSDLPLGISLGSATADAHPYKMQELFARADAAMYRDKAQNRPKLRSLIVAKFLEDEDLS